MKSKPIEYQGGLVMPGSEAYDMWMKKDLRFVGHMQQVHNAAVKRGEIKEVPHDMGRARS